MKDNLVMEFDEIEKKVQSSFKNQGFMEFLGAKIIDLKSGYCEIELPFRNELTQQNGFFHAGTIASIADTAAGYASFSMMENESDILTIELKINFLAAAKGEKIVAKANVIKSGRTLTIARCDVFAVSNDSQTLCAALQSSLIQIRD